MLFRGTIPAGFMPAIGAAKKAGALLMICHHGEPMAMAMSMARGHGDSDKSQPPGKETPHPTLGLEQCPFGAAAAVLVVGTPPWPILASVAATPLQVLWTSLASRGPPPFLNPPARGPPIPS